MKKTEIIRLELRGDNPLSLKSLLEKYSKVDSTSVKKYELLEDGKKLVAWVALETDLELPTPAPAPTHDTIAKPAKKPVKPEAPNNGEINIDTTGIIKKTGRKRAVAASRQHTGNIIDLPDQLEDKECSRCGLPKPLSQFSRRMRYGYVTYTHDCLVCRREINRKWYADPENRVSHSKKVAEKERERRGKKQNDLQKVR